MHVINSQEPPNMDPTLLDQKAPPVIITLKDDHTTPKSKSKTGKAPEDTSIPDSPPSSASNQTDESSSGIGNVDLLNSPVQNGSTSHQSPESFSLAPKVDNQSVRSTSTVQDGCASQQSPKLPPINTNFDEDYWSNSKCIITPGTVQYWPPSLQPRRLSDLFSNASSDHSPSDPPNPPRTSRASITVQPTGLMYQSLNSSSQGHNQHSPADQPISPRTVQDTYAMDQLKHPSPIISRGGHFPLTNNEPVAPTASQPIPSSGNHHAISVDSQGCPSKNNHSDSSSDNQYIYSCDSQFTSNNNNQSAFSRDNRPPPININQCVPYSEDRFLSAPPEGQIQRYAEQQTVPPTLDLHSLVGEVFVAAFTSDGRHILFCPRHQGLQLWNFQTGARVPLSHEMIGGVCTFTISPNGAQVATGCFDGSIRLWRGQAYAAERALLGHTYTISKLLYSPCGQWLVSCDMNGTVRLWDLHDIDDQGEVVEPGAGDGIFKYLVFAPTGHEFIALSDDSARFYNPQNRNPCTSVHKTSFKSPVYPLDYSQDGLRLVFRSGFGNYSVHVRDPQAESDFELEGHSHEVVCAVFSPCGKQILSGSRDKTSLEGFEF
ncbi:MAG: WD40-repeat-containing domain protein [Linnemannia elongata]|nr:MAG: WD40-repeat-containing domain protein [Linnemannia elongata]